PGPRAAMTHKLFGKLKYRERDEQWIGYVPLPRFAAIGVRPPDEPLTEADAETMIADMNRALENMKGLLREQYGDKADPAFTQFDREAAGQELKALEKAELTPDPLEVEHERKRAERARRHAERLAQGRYLIGIGTPPGSEPTAKQEAAFRFVYENEQAVYDAV